MPKAEQLFHISRGRADDIRVLREQLRGLRLVLHPDKKSDRPALPRCQRDLRHQGAAAVSVVIQLTAKIALRNACGVPVTVIAAEKSFPVAAVRGYFRAGHAKKPLLQAVPLRPAHIHTFQVPVDQVPDPVPLEQRAGDKERILQVHLVLFVIAVVRELSVSGEAQVPGCIRAVLYTDPPDLILLVQRDIIERLRTDPCVFRHDLRVAGAMPAFAPVSVEGLSHGLPGGRPVIAGPIVADIDVTSRPVCVVEHIPQDPSVRAGAHETVPTGIVRDQRSVFGGAEIVGPGRRSVRPGDHIFPVRIVKIAVIHDDPPVIQMTFFLYQL